MGTVIPSILGIVFILSFIGLIFYGIFLLFSAKVKELRDFIIINIIHRPNRSLKNKYEIHLQDKFTYYNKLSPLMKVKFLVRLRNFISEKTFEKRGDIEITDEMKTLIAAAAIQITFGLEEYMFEYFEMILIYPDSFLSNNDERYKSGEVNTQGIIVISWNDLLKGYANQTDKYNVGLHEMAHALELEQRSDNGDYDMYFASYFPKWSKIASEEYENIQNERASVLRKYAGVNKQEFFAVC